MWVKSKGKNTEGNDFTVMEKVDKFPFPFKSEKLENYREFPSEGKSRENTGFFRGKENPIYYKYIIRHFSLTVKGGKKGGLKRCPPSFLPLSFDRRDFHNKQAILHFKEVKRW